MKSSPQAEASHTLGTILDKSARCTPDTIPNTPASYDTEDTVPNTPLSHQLENDSDHQGDFARFIPFNTLACRAFHDVAEKLRSNPDYNKHTRQYMHVEYGARAALSKSSDSDTERSSDKVSQCSWTGYYRLNLNIRPFDLQRGWMIGSGRADLDHEGVDFLLTAKRRQHGVCGRHARIVHNLKTNALLIIADRPRWIFLDGKEKLKGDSRLVWSRETGVTIGDLAYKLVFTKLSDSVYREQLSSLRRDAGWTYEPPLTLQPTPQCHHYQYRNYIIKATFAEGSTCTVAAGIRLNGLTAVAIKKIKRTRKNIWQIKQEVAILKKIGQHPRVCHLVEDLYSGGDGEGLGANEVGEVYLIYEPLARERFHDIAVSDLSDEDRVVLLKQCCEGLAFLHGIGLMHRDIKPGNLAVVSRKPLSAILLDFGAATLDQQSSDHMAGTIPYLAPEVIALKEGASRKPYDKMVDIWGLGLSCFELFCRKPGCQARRAIDRSIYEDIRHTLRSSVWHPAIQPVIRLVARMILWDAEERLSAAEVLSDLALCNIGDGSTDSTEMARSKRQKTC